MNCTEFLFVFALIVPAQPEKPESLRRMEQSRQAITAARFEWSRIDQPKTTSEKQREVYHTTRYSGADQLEIHHGDSDGLLYPNLLGDDLAYSELRLLKKDNEEWRLSEDTFSASITTTPQRFNGIFDIRTLGMVPSMSGRMNASQYLPAEPESFEESVKGTIHHVKAILSGGRAVSWEIDAEKDYSPVRCDIIYNGQVLGESKCEYEQFDGMWFPVETVFFRDGAEVSRVVVTEASFNTEDDKRELTPHDLGILPGTTVGRDSDIGKTAPMWDGEKAVPPMDYFNAVKAGKIDNSHFADFNKRIKTEGQGRHPKKYDDASYGLVGVERTPGLWEEYVRRFIRKNKLDRPTSRKAWRHHKVCQTDALKYLKEKRTELDELDRELEKARAGGESERNTVKAVEARRERKLGPVGKIFEDRLKPGLNKLVKPKEPAATVATPVSPASSP